MYRRKRYFFLGTKRAKYTFTFIHPHNNTIYIMYKDTFYSKKREERIAFITTKTTA